MCIRDRLWLCPRIGEFQALYPEIALSIQTPRQLDEADNPNVDLFIAFGDGGWPGYNVELLSEVDYTPMCSPAMLNRLGGFAGPAAVSYTHLDVYKRQPLIPLPSIAVAVTVNIPFNFGVNKPSFDMDAKAVLETDQLIALLLAVAGKMVAVSCWGCLLYTSRCV